MVGPVISVPEIFWSVPSTNTSLRFCGASLPCFLIFFGPPLVLPAIHNWFNVISAPVITWRFVNLPFKSEIIIPYAPSSALYPVFSGCLLLINDGNTDAAIDFKKLFFCALPPHLEARELYPDEAVFPLKRPLPPPADCFDNGESSDSSRFPAPTVPFGEEIPLLTLNPTTLAKAPRIPPLKSMWRVGLGSNPSVPGRAAATIGIKGLYKLVSLNGCRFCNNNCFNENITPLPDTLNFEIRTTSCKADPIGNARLSYFLIAFVPLFPSFGLYQRNGWRGPNFNKLLA